MKPQVTLPEGGELAKNKARAEVFAKAQEEMTRPSQEAFVNEDGTSPDEFATEMGQDFLIAAETGREVIQELSDEVHEEDEGGPFVETAAGAEVAEGFDASNPPGSTREPFPKTMAD